MIDVGRLLTINETCERLSIGRTKFYRLVNDGEIKVLKLGGNHRVSEQALEDFINSLPVGVRQK